LPFLCEAREVCLLRCDAALEDAIDAADVSLELARQWLGRHGVQADVCVRRAGLDVGDALLAHANSTGADLLVMGAWGRPRWSERLLGGATRTLLLRANLPVLMAH
jgi:nucleotide-binding universal stress UspA family protein